MNVTDRALAKHVMRWSRSPDGWYDEYGARQAGIVWSPTTDLMAFEELMTQLSTFSEIAALEVDELEKGVSVMFSNSFRERTKEVKRTSWDENSQMAKCRAILKAVKFVNKYNDAREE